MSSTKPSETARLTSLPPEIILKIGSLLNPSNVLALIHASRCFWYLFSVFTSRYMHNQPVMDRLFTPLQFFIWRGVHRGVVHLLSTGASPNDATSGPPLNQKAPLILAICVESAETVALLLKHGARVEDRDYTGGWVFDDGAIPERVNDWGFTPLHILLRLRTGSDTLVLERRSMLQSLLAAGADIEARTDNTHTPLHIACGKRNPDVALVSALLAAGGNPAACTVMQRGDLFDCWIQPLHYAAVAGNKDVVEVLLAAGVDVDARTHDGLRALDLALLGMHEGTFQVLLDAGADIAPASETRPGPLDPARLMKGTTTWRELEAWFMLRGWRWKDNVLAMWAGYEVCKDMPRESTCGQRSRW